MQALLSYEQSPPLAAPFRFFLTAPCCGVLAGLLLIVYGEDALVMRWTPAALALTHAVTAGLMLQAMLGALIQILPVVVGVNLAAPGALARRVHALSILGLAALTLDLSDTNSLAEAQAKIAEFSRANPTRPWILGRGWNQEKWGLGRFPTAVELDAAVADRPVYLQRVDGHAGWANSMAMQVAGITAQTKSPAGGRVERVAGTQQPAGVFVDAAEQLMQAAIPAR